MPAASAIVGLGGSLISGFLGANAASNAANAQVTSQNNAITGTNAARDAALAAQNRVYLQDQQNIDPYLKTGTAALSQLGTGTAPGGEFNSTPTAGQVMALDPGYQFNLEQGQQAVERAAAAAGGLNSGGALKAASQYATNYTTNAYQNAYNQFLNTRQANYSNLSNLAGLGQNANSQLLNAGTNYANESAAIGTNAAAQNGNYLSNAGNAQASGYIGRANALGGMTSSLANIGQGLPWNKWFGGSGTPGSEFDAAGNYLGD